jgi:hypothetical protein
MGDRGNIVLDYGNKQRIFFYTHWYGSEIRTILKDAIIRGRDRTGDASYLARIIFSELIKNNLMDTTGFGISPNMGDNEHSLLVVDLSSNKVWLEDEKFNKISNELTFDEFIKQKECWSDIDGY